MLLAAIVLALYALVAAVVLTTPYGDPFNVIARLTALRGFLALAIAAILTPFLREIMKVFGKSFLSVHHTFAAVGLLLPTMHPVPLAIGAMNLLYSSRSSPPGGGSGHSQAGPHSISSTSRLPGCCSGDIFRGTGGGFTA